MAFWCRIKQSNLRSLLNQSKRCYFQVPALCSVNHISGHARIRLPDKPFLGFHQNQTELFNNVRFFAAPVQYQLKKEEKDDGPRLNEKITADFVRLVTDEGHDIVSRREALERAKKLGLDLVEVQGSSKPPVCKLMDYQREMYNRKQKFKEKKRDKKSKSEVTLKTGASKEIRFTEKIEQKDLKMKADMVKRLTERGYRVKCSATITAKDTDDEPDPIKKEQKKKKALSALLSRLTTLLEDFSIVDTGPQVETKQAYVVVRHIKFGPPKKGGKGAGNKASKAGITDNVVQESTPSPLEFEGDWDPADDSSGESEDDYDVEQTEASIPLKFDSTPPGKVPSSPYMAPQGIENRYKSRPGNTPPPRTPTDYRGSGVRDPMRSGPQFANQPRQPKFEPNFPAPAREASHPSAASPPKSFGAFSNSPKANDTPRQQGVPGEVNRYKGGNTFGSSARKRGP